MSCVVRRYVVVCVVSKISNENAGFIFKSKTVKKEEPARDKSKVDFLTLNKKGLQSLETPGPFRPVIQLRVL